MRALIGCMVFILGGLTVAAYDALIDHVSPGYIDRDGAIAEAIDAARRGCRQTEIARTDCVHFTIKSVSESKDGWTIEVQSFDRKRISTSWIGRRGEYDSLGDETRNSH